jgi:hypothetical protein
MIHEPRGKSIGKIDVLSYMKSQIKKTEITIHIPSQQLSEVFEYKK